MEYLGSATQSELLGNFKINFTRVSEVLMLKVPLKFKPYKGSKIFVDYLEM